MQCDRCNEQYSTVWHRVYRHDNHKEVYICEHCMYEEFLREKDEARKEFLKLCLGIDQPKPKLSFIKKTKNYIYKKKEKKNNIYAISRMLETETNESRKKYLKKMLDIESHTIIPNFLDYILHEGRENK